MLNLLPSIFVLGLAALAALLLALNRRSPPDKVAERSAAAHALALATVMQIIHFGEETVTGFHVSLPGMLGLPEIPLSLFITFNLVWIGLWFASVPGLRAARTFAFFAENWAEELKEPVGN